MVAVKNLSVINFSVEGHFAKKLASNDPKIRRKAVKSLKCWFKNKSKSSKEFSEEELMKFWKGLFYCMWMCDKALAQEELADCFGELMMSFSKFDHSLLFCDTFFKTMARDWFNIDRFRIEKFLMLVRIMIRKLFELVLKQKKVSKKLWPIGKMNDMLKNTVLSTSDAQCPASLKTHVADLYLNELERVSTGKVSQKSVLKFIHPFCIILSKSKTHAHLSSVSKSVFEAIMDNTVYYKMRNDDDDDEPIDSDDDDMEYVNIRGERITPSMKPGTTPIKFDCAKISEVLFGIAKADDVSSKNRKLCYGIVKKLKMSDSGEDPLTSVIKIDGVENKRELEDMAVSSLLEDEQLYRAERKEWKQMMRIQKLAKNETEESDTNEESDLAVDDSNDVIEKSINESENFESSENNCNASEGENVKKNKKRKLVQANKVKQKKTKCSNNSDVEPEKSRSFVECLVNNDESVLTEKSLNEKLPASRNGDRPKEKRRRKESKLIEKKKIKSGVKIDETNSLHNDSVGNSKLIVEVGRTDSNVDLTCNDESSLKHEKDNRSSKVNSRYFKADPNAQSDDLPEGDIEIFIPSKKYKRNKNVGKEQKSFIYFENICKMPPAFVRRSVRKLKGMPKRNKKEIPDIGQPVNFSGHGSFRKVNFKLNKNKTHDLRDYSKTILSSPQIPYSAEKKPFHSALKKNK